MKAVRFQQVVLIGGTVCLFPSCISLWSKKPETPPMIQKNNVSPVPPPGSFPPPPPPAPAHEPERPIVTPVDGPKPAAPPVAKPTTSIPTARPIPGKEGVVFSPFNNKPIDVKGFASGTLVADPTYPLDQKKYFRVP